MTGKSGEVVEALKRRLVEVCCRQETRWKGEGTREIGERGSGYKFFWRRQEDGQGGIRMLIAEELEIEVAEVKRLSARVLVERLMGGSGVLRIVSVYAPQAGMSE